MNFKVMSFNLWCGGVTPERTERVFAMIRKYDPDILGVQEATPQWMKLLKEAFPAYTACGIGREGGDKGEYSAVFAKNARFTVKSECTRWLTGTPEEFSFVEGSLCPRVYTCAELTDNCDGSRLYHVNTHLDHGPEEVRVIQAKYLHEFLETLDAPFSVTGDFNCEEGTSPSYQSFTASLIEDSKMKAEQKYAAPTFHGYHDLKAIIDFCFIRRGDYTVEDYRVLDELIDGEHPSDHNPVLVTLCRKA
ncbi:MAG: endonuclease/exonuclease/phosphatase family protein [Clostridia bacterium]|nr:endonuclease/exonuclease/phosphatase family protein [Clostridia bacterium]